MTHRGNGAGAKAGSALHVLGLWLGGIGICCGALLLAAPADAQFSIQVAPGGRSGGGFGSGNRARPQFQIEPRASQESTPERQCEEASGQAAVEACTAAYYLDKSNPKNLRRLGDAYLATGRPNEALGAYTESLRLDPGDDKAQKGRQAALSYLAASAPPGQASAPAPAPAPAPAYATPAPAAPSPYAAAQPAPAPAPSPAPAPPPVAAAPPPPPAPEPAMAKPAPAAAAATPAVPVDKKPPVITAPAKLETAGPVVEVSGRVADESTVVEFSVNGQPVALGANGRFTLRRGVPVGTSELKLAAVDEWGNQSEKTVAVTRAAPAAQAAAAAPPAKAAGAKDPAAGDAAPRAPATQSAAVLPSKNDGDNARPASVVEVADQLKGIKFGRYRALVIGNNGYQRIKKLETAAKDAQSIAALLKKDYGFQVDLMIDATRGQILEALYKLRAELTETDSLLVYYAGHGFMDKDTGRGYWLPVDAAADIPTQWISTTDLTDVIKAMGARHIMVVADSCYSGTLTRSAAAGLRSAQSDNLASWVKRILAKRSRTVMSSGGLEPVMDSGGEGHSVFAQAFIDALRDNDSVMDGQSLFAAIRRPIVLNSDQTPEYSDIRQAGHDGGDFLFVRR